MFADSRGGKIINIVSLLSFQDGIRVPSDAASNSGLAGVTRV
jgi:2-dehydro-3-deoxy-D-gluconate 5-dehydrogenase